MEFLLQATVASATVVVIVQEIWKLRIVPNNIANRYPGQVNIALSIVVAITTAPLSGINWAWSNVGDIASLAALTAVSAAIAYNQLIGKIAELKQLEGAKE